LNSTSKCNFERIRAVSWGKISASLKINSKERSWDPTHSLPTIKDTISTHFWRQAFTKQRSLKQSVSINPQSAENSDVITEGEDIGPNKRSDSPRKGRRKSTPGSNQKIGNWSRVWSAWTGVHSRSVTIAGITNYYPSATIGSTNISTKTKEAVEASGYRWDAVKTIVQNSPDQLAIGDVTAAAFNKASEIVGEQIEIFGTKPLLSKPGNWF